MLVSEVTTLLQATFDSNIATTAICETFINSRVKQMIADSLWRTTETSLGTTVAGTSRYAVPATVVDLRQVYIGTYSAPALFDVVSQDQLLSLRDTSREFFLRGDGAGVFAQGFDSSAGAFIDLEPAPSTAGQTIVGVEAVLPSTLASSDPLPVPDDFALGPYYGAKADLYLFEDEREDLAQPNEARFQDYVGKLAGRRNTRFGSGARSVAVSVGGR